MDNQGKISSVSSATTQPSEFAFTGGDYLVFTNILLYNCIKLYQKEFKSNKIPATFVKFYIYELSGYEHLFDEKLSQYFKEVTGTKNRVAVMMKAFESSFPQYVIKSGEEDYVLFIEVGKKEPPQSIIYATKSNKYLISSINSLKLAIKHYNKSDELHNVSYLFRDYLYNTYTADAPNEADDAPIMPAVTQAEQNQTVIEQNAPAENPAEQNNAKPVVETSPDERRKKAALLTGRQISIPQQRGKVVSVLFPILPLPTAYPVLNENSRINTDLRVQRFLAPSEEITLINRYCFNQIKYSLDFINKRKVIAFDLKKATRFDFNF